MYSDCCTINDDRKHICVHFCQWVSVLSDDDYCTSQVVRCLRKSKNSLAEKHNVQKLINELKQVLAKENSILYILNEFKVNSEKATAELQCINNSTESTCF